MTTPAPASTGITGGIWLLEDTSPWQILFWRGFGVFVGQGVILAWLYRANLLSQFIRIGRWGLVASLLNGCSPAGFFFALTHTTVANVVVLLSLGPFCAALLAWLVIGERVPGLTWAASPRPPSSMTRPVQLRTSSITRASSLS